MTFSSPWNVCKFVWIRLKPPYVWIQKCHQKRKKKSFLSIQLATWTKGSLLTPKMMFFTLIWLHQILILIAVPWIARHMHWIPVMNGVRSVRRGLMQPILRRKVLVLDVRKASPGTQRCKPDESAIPELVMVSLLLFGWFLISLVGTNCRHGYWLHHIKKYYASIQSFLRRMSNSGVWRLRQIRSGGWYNLHEWSSSVSNATIFPNRYEWRSFQLRSKNLESPRKKSNLLNRSSSLPPQVERNARRHPHWDTRFTGIRNRNMVKPKQSIQPAWRKHFTVLVICTPRRSGARCLFMEWILQYEHSSQDKVNINGRFHTLN